MLRNKYIWKITSRQKTSLVILKTQQATVLYLGGLNTRLYITPQLEEMYGTVQG